MVDARTDDDEKLGLYDRLKDPKSQRKTRSPKYNAATPRLQMVKGRVPKHKIGIKKLSIVKKDKYHSELLSRRVDVRVYKLKLKMKRVDIRVKNSRAISAVITSNKVRRVDIRLEKLDIPPEKRFWEPDAIAALSKAAKSRTSAKAKKNSKASAVNNIPPPKGKEPPKLHLLKASPKTIKDRQLNAKIVQSYNEGHEDDIFDTIDLYRDGGAAAGGRINLLDTSGLDTSFSSSCSSRSATPLYKYHPRHTNWSADTPVGQLGVPTTSPASDTTDTPTRTADGKEPTPSSAKV